MRPDGLLRLQLIRVKTTCFEVRKDFKTKLKIIQGPIQQKPWPIQIVTDFQDSCRQSRQLQPENTVADYKNNYRQFTGSLYVHAHAHAQINLHIPPITTISPNYKQS